MCPHRPRPLARVLVLTRPFTAAPSLALPSQDQYGAAHGRAVALWMEGTWDRQTYFFKEIFKNVFWMKRSDWHYGTDWYETWMAWETEEYPSLTIDVIADSLTDYLRATAGWEVSILDWTAANMAQQQNAANGAGPAHAAPAQ